MRRGTFRTAFLAGVVAVALLPATAGAHDEGHESGAPSGSDTFHNMTLLSSDPPSAGQPTTSSDLAFWGTRAYAATYHGFRVYDISGATPVLLADMQCAGAQGDPSVWDRDGDGTADLLIQSVDRTMTGPECGATPTTAHADVNGWEGLRIFDVGDLANIRLIASVYQDCGSHTNTLIPRPTENRLLVLNSSYPLQPGPTCGPVRGPESGRHAVHGTVQVVEVPLGNPTAAREITELPISYPGDNDNNYLPISEHGINGGVVGGGLVDGMRACHEIAVFTGAGLAAGACGEQAQMWRLDPVTGLPDTANPLWVYDQDNVDFWHSATFSWDGKVVAFIDESFGSGCPPVTVKRVRLGREERPYQSGNTFFLDARTGELLSEFRLPRTSQDPSAYCSSHNGAVIPARDRYLLTSGYYSAGTSIVEFSDPRAPREIAFGDRAGARTWAAYWYEYGDKQRRVDDFRVYASDGVGAPGPANNGFEAWDAHLGNAIVVQQQRLNPQLQEELLQTFVNPRRPVTS